MGAGGSARNLAERTASAASVLQKKADHAARMSAAFLAGAEGEESLATSFAPLAAQGWLALPDRQTPRGGNLDLIIVGPAGVAVIDAKNWSYSATVKGDRLYTGRFCRTDSL